MLQDVILCRRRKKNWQEALQTNPMSLTSLWAAWDVLDMDKATENCTRAHGFRWHRRFWAHKGASLSGASFALTKHPGSYAKASGASARGSRARKRGTEEACVRPLTRARPTPGNLGGRAEGKTLKGRHGSECKHSPHPQSGVPSSSKSSSVSCWILMSSSGPWGGGGLTQPSLSNL